MKNPTVKTKPRGASQPWIIIGHNRVDILVFPTQTHHLHVRIFRFCVYHQFEEYSINVCVDGSVISERSWTLNTLSLSNSTGSSVTYYMQSFSTLEAWWGGELGPAPPFPPMRASDSSGLLVTGSQSLV